MNENEKSLVTREQEIATAATLYGAERDIKEFGYAIKSFAPWAEKMENKDVSLVVRRSLAMGLDPLNPHEVQIWVDNRGKVQFQLAYTLTVQWVKHFKGEHTEPLYEPLTQADLDMEGLDHGCMAFYCRFIMKLARCGVRAARGKRSPDRHRAWGRNARRAVWQIFRPSGPQPCVEGQEASAR
jgi:hypothetical protein